MPLFGVAGAAADRAGPPGDRERRARVFAVGVRRLPDGRIAGRLLPVPVAADGTRRERIAATLTALAQRRSRTLIADAPEQWSAVFFPIWPDLAEPAEGEASTAPAEVEPSETRTDGPAEVGTRAAADASATGAGSR